MKNSKVISTVIPTFNRELYLRKAIQSCIDQTIEHEIIVCNHGGTDQTDEMVKEFNNKIKYLKKTKDYGPHYCWLDGIIEAKGEYINLLFDDDWIEPNYIEECMKYFHDPDVGFVFSPANLFDEDSKKIVSILHDDFLSKEGIYKINEYELFLLRRLISPTAIIFRKKDMIDSLYNGNLPLSKYNYKGVGPDRFMSLLCMLRYSKFGFVSKPLVYFRQHSKSITVGSEIDSEKKQLIKKAYDEVDKYYYVLKYGNLFSFFHNRYIFKLRFCLNIAYNFIKGFFKKTRN